MFEVGDKVKWQDGLNITYEIVYVDENANLLHLEWFSLHYNQLTKADYVLSTMTDNIKRGNVIIIDRPEFRIKKRIKKHILT